MKYVVFGLGGVGSVVAEGLAKTKREVTGIAHGAHLEAMQAAGGLTMRQPNGKAALVKGLDVMSADEYQAAHSAEENAPDVVFVCVKDYSLESTYPFLESVCAPNTVVIPLSNVYGTGERIDKRLKETMGDAAPLVTCGCIYVAAEIEEPGIVRKNGNICRVIFGMPDPEQVYPTHERLYPIVEDTTQAFECKLSQEIQRDHLVKLSFVSSQTVASLIFGCCNAEAIAGIPGIRMTFANATQEVINVAAAQGILLGQGLVEANLNTIDKAKPGTTTSCIRDLQAGRPSEIEGLVRQIVTWGAGLGVPTPAFARASAIARDQFGV